MSGSAGIRSFSQCSAADFGQAVDILDHWSIDSLAFGTEKFLTTRKLLNYISVEMVIDTHLIHSPTSETCHVEGIIALIFLGNTPPTCSIYLC